MKLSLAEAEEIYACLIHKLVEVKLGSYRASISGDQPQEMFDACVVEENEIQIKWIQDLTALIKKIGVDGKNLCK